MISSRVIIYELGFDFLGDRRKRRKEEVFKLLEFWVLRVYMSLNQSRFDENESHYRKPGGGRSGTSSGGHGRNFSASRGPEGGGPTPSSAPPLSTNRCYKKVKKCAKVGSQE